MAGLRSVGAQRRACGCVLGVCTIIFAALPAQASETIIYTYDPLGRLIGSSAIGGPSDGLTTSTTFDPAGNRSNYVVNGAPGGPPCILSIGALYGGAITEGGTARFFIERTGSCPSEVTVNYVTLDGTAQAGTHYQPFNGFREFQGSTNIVYIDVPTAWGDYSTPLTFQMRVSTGDAGVGIGTSTATFTIYDD